MKMNKPDDLVEKLEDVYIRKIKSDGIEYKVWTHTEAVRPYIYKELEKIFPDKLIPRELDNIDLCVPAENLPIEIQATPLNKGYPQPTEWENKTQRQITLNIDIYGKCWLFFDSELLRYMVNSIKTSINLTWLRLLMKEEKLRVFTVSHNGTIEEKEYKDFDFLYYISQTCPKGKDNDNRILNSNKMCIYNSITTGYGFNQKELNDYVNGWRNNMKNGREDFKVFCRRQEDNERIKLYGSILFALSSLPRLNKLMDFTANKSERASAKHDLSKMGVFDITGIGPNSVTTFVDKFNICKYLPGYIRNKEKWDIIKGHPFYSEQSLT